MNKFPKVNKKHLLLIAGFAWTFAGTMLLTRGTGFLLQSEGSRFLMASGSLSAGLLFYFLIFDRISRKHTRRILEMPVLDPPFYWFFDLKAYILMIIMISGGVLLRTSGILPVRWMAIIYMTMGVPLFLSAIRFFHSWYHYTAASAEHSQK